MSEKRKVRPRIRREDRLEHEPTGSGMGAGAGEKNPENEHLLVEPVKLDNPEAEEGTPGHADKPHSEAGAQGLLPHERDQTTRPLGTSQDNEDENSRDKMEQAAEDTRRGLKDTDRRGIPSEIIADSDTPNAAAKARKKKR
jgi:hypothetical protein